MRDTTYTVELVRKEESSRKFHTKDYCLAMQLLELETAYLSEKGYKKVNMTCVHRGFLNETYYTVYFKKEGDA